MDFDRNWTPYALKAEYDFYEFARIAAAGNALRAERDEARRELAAYKQALTDVSVLNKDEGVFWACREINSLVARILAANAK